MNIKNNAITSFDQLVLQTIGGLNDVEAVDEAMKSTSFDDVFPNVEYDPLDVAEQSFDLGSSYEIDPAILNEIARTDNPFGLADQFGSEDNNDIADRNTFSDVGDFVSKSFEQRDPEATDSSAATRATKVGNNTEREDASVLSTTAPSNEYIEFEAVSNLSITFAVHELRVEVSTRSIEFDAEEESDLVSAGFVRNVQEWQVGDGFMPTFKIDSYTKPVERDHFSDNENQVIELDFDSIGRDQKQDEAFSLVQDQVDKQEPVAAVGQEIEEVSIEVIGVAPVVTDAELV